MMKPKESVLILGDPSALMSTLTERIPLLGFQCVRAKTPREAIDLAHDRNFRYGVCVLEPSLPAFDLVRALDSLRTQTSSPCMTFLASGDPPDAETRDRLRGAGVVRAAWSPVSDNVLRFQLNEAFCNDSDTILRGEPRAPVEFNGIVTVGGRAKRVAVYSLSGAGAYLVTQRPSLPGAEIRLDIPMNQRRVSLAARVLYANVPGNLARPRLPHGMAVSFVDPNPPDAIVLRERVNWTLGGLSV